MPILELSEAKTLLQIKTDQHDEFLTTAIPLVEEHVKTFCRKEFADGFPGGVKLAATEFLKYALQNRGVQSESIGDYSVTFLADIPESVKKILRPYKVIKFV